MNASPTREAATYTYRVKTNDNGFRAQCDETQLCCEGDTMASAITALRTAIERRDETRDRLK